MTGESSQRRHLPRQIATTSGPAVAPAPPSAPVATTAAVVAAAVAVTNVDSIWLPLPLSLPPLLLLLLLLLSGGGGG